MRPDSFLRNISVQFPVPGFRAVLENDFQYEGSDPESQRNLRGWLCAELPVFGIALKMGKCVYPAILSHANKDVAESCQGQFSCKFHLPYRNNASLFRDEDRQDTVLRLDLANGQNLFSLPLFRKDVDYQLPNVQRPPKFNHDGWVKELLSRFDRPDLRVLQIDACNYGPNPAKRLFNHAFHTGFYHAPGPNIDIVGVPEELDRHFEKESLDLVFSSAMFQFLENPWQTANQIIKLLKPGGCIFVETPFTFSARGGSPIYWHFTDDGLRMLFSEKKGIKCIESGMSNPIVGRFSSSASGYLQNLPVNGLYCHAEFFGQKMI